MGHKTEGKVEMMGSAGSTVQKLLKKLEAGLPAVGNELRWHRLAQGHFLASIVPLEVNGSEIFVLCFLRVTDSGCIWTALAGQVSGKERRGSCCSLFRGASMHRRCSSSTRTSECH